MPGELKSKRHHFFAVVFAALALAVALYSTFHAIRFLNASEQSSVSTTIFSISQRLLLSALLLYIACVDPRKHRVFSIVVIALNLCLSLALLVGYFVDFFSLYREGAHTSASLRWYGWSFCKVLLRLILAAFIFVIFIKKDVVAKNISVVALFFAIIILAFEFVDASAYLPGELVAQGVPELLRSYMIGNSTTPCYLLASISAYFAALFYETPEEIKEP